MQVADIFAKPLSQTIFKDIHSKLGMKNIYSQMGVDKIFDLFVFFHLPCVFLVKLDDHYLVAQFFLDGLV